MRTWQGDKAWSDRYTDAIASIAGRYLIKVAPEADDTMRNTDLTVFSVNGGRMGARIRDAQYYARYGNEFTIRTSRPSGNATELEKLMSGWGNYFFYGFASGEPGQLQAWCLVDLTALRAWFHREMISNKGQLPGSQCTNKDGVTFLAVSASRAQRAGVVIAQQGMAPNVETLPVAPSPAQLRLFA